VWRYILPSVGGLFVTYLYNVVDGIFVGQGVGWEALGAVNIAVPFITTSVAAAAMFPMGGATIAAIKMGKGDNEGANRSFVTALLMTLALSVILMIAGMLLSGPITMFSGASKLSGAVQDMAKQYLLYCAAFMVPSLMSTCLSVFVRNDDAPGLAFVGMCSGAAANIFLDWLFIFPMQMGVTGAAVASGLGQVISVLILMSHFIRKKGILRIRLRHFSAGMCTEIAKSGVAESVTQLTTPVTAFCYNIVLAAMIGDIGVTTFSVLSFIYSLANAILSGVAQGLQPLWGLSKGRNDRDSLRMYLRFGLGFGSMLAAVIFVILCLFDTQTIRIFNSDTELVEMASSVLPVFAASFIPMAVNLVITAYLYSVRKNLYADIIALSRGVFVKAVAIFLLPQIAGAGTVWGAPLAAELITLIVAILFLQRESCLKNFKSLTGGKTL